MLRQFRPSFIAVPLVLALALTLGACGDDGAETDDAASGTDATTTTTTTANTVAGETTVPPETTSTEVPVDASGIARDHLRLKYTSTGEPAGDIEIAVVGTKSVFKVVASTQNSFLLVDGDTATTCAWTEPPIQCSRVSGNGQDYSVATQVFLDPKATGGTLAGAPDIHDVADRTFAGRTAKCQVGTVGDAEAEQCVDSELGILLYVKSGTSEIQLTEISGDVDDSVFELPEGATVTDSPTVTTN